MAYKTLVIAPKTDLAFADDEVMQVVNLLGARLLQGSQATIHGLLAILREGWDIVWLCTHANEQGWYLSDGIVNASEMTQLVRSAGVILTVMNTCSSYQVARAIHRELGIAFVCTIKEIPDRSAFITGTIFAQKLATGLDFKSAYEAALPGENDTYTFLAAKGMAMPPVHGRGSEAKSDGEMLGRLELAVNRLDAIVRGNTDLGIEGLMAGRKKTDDKIDLLLDDVASLKADVAQLKANQKFNRVMLILLSVFVFLFLVVTAISLYGVWGAS